MKIQTMRIKNDPATIRWNGWGDTRVTYPVVEPALQFLAEYVGKSLPHQDVSLETTLNSVPTSRFGDHQLYTKEPLDRLLHARGQSLPDWIALRSGQIGTFPDAVAYPTEEEHIHACLDFAYREGVQVIPYGGGTSVVGHINPLPSDQPVMCIDLRGLNGLVMLDDTSSLATFQTGIYGPDLERQLGRRGFTLGHFPQSFEFSTLGGWIATRSSGQQSYHYGRIEDLFAGGKLISPAGILEIPPGPASAAGPDLKQLILGSEGRFGILTRATLRIRKTPDRELFYGVIFPNWESGVAAVRTLAQSGAAVSMLRLSDALETAVTFALSGSGRLAEWGTRALNLLGFREGRCLLIVGITGQGRQIDQTRRRVNYIFKIHNGRSIGAFVGNQWKKNRFRTPYLRNTLWDRGYALDTLETALPWAGIEVTATKLRDALQKGLETENERVLVLVHLSHVYLDGASIYVTYLFRRDRDYENTLRRWALLKSLASNVIVTRGGTISHQHGVGVDHAPYLEAEKGHLGISALQSLSRQFDPKGLLNPGKLLPLR